MWGGLLGLCQACSSAWELEPDDVYMANLALGPLLEISWLAGPRGEGRALSGLEQVEGLSTLVLLLPGLYF